MELGTRNLTVGDLIILRLVRKRIFQILKEFPQLVTVYTILYLWNISEHRSVFVFGNSFGERSVYRISKSKTRSILENDVY